MRLPLPLDGIAYTGLLVAAPLVLPDLERISPINPISGIPADVPVRIPVPLWIRAYGRVLR